MSIVPGTCSRHFVPSSRRPFREGTHLGVIPNSFQLQPQTPPLSGPLGSLRKVHPDSGHPPHLHCGRPPLPPAAPEDHRLPSPVTGASPQPAVKPHVSSVGSEASPGFSVLVGVPSQGGVGLAWSSTSLPLSGLISLSANRGRVSWALGDEWEFTGPKKEGKTA